ncbi:MAG: hypothetical protein QF747_03095 [Patescibacteria group bacterium]|nr:hypothetical protein [Patescibacteria group bacterium]MDP6756323.1 hypothetical protein [Patescibacteria group bacterium]
MAEELLVRDNGGGIIYLERADELPLPPVTADDSAEIKGAPAPTAEIEAGEMEDFPIIE